MKCECPAAGLCSRRGCEIPGVHWNKCQAGQVATIDKLYEFSPAHPERKGVSYMNQRIGVGTALKARIASLLAIKADGGSCGCNNLAQQMDKWGPQECEVRREFIVGKLMENKRMLIDAMTVVEPTVLQSITATLVGWIVGSGLTDSALRAGAHWMLTQAINETVALIASIPRPKPPRIATTNLGAVRGPSVEPIDTSDLIRNLQMHIWPTANGAWRWNCDEVMRRSSLFNGRRIVAIAVDDASCSADEVKEYLKGFTDDFIVVTNNPQLREVESWLPLLERQHSLDSREVTFSCHSKISRHDVSLVNEHSTLYRWTSAMYETCLDHWEFVREQLAIKAMTGSFKRYGMFGTPRNHRWHYSGTFYWFRNRDVFQRDWKTVDQRFFGTEAYPGLLFHPDDTGCLFADNAKDLYKLDYWDSEIQPALERWRNERSVQTA